MSEQASSEHRLSIPTRSLFIGEDRAVPTTHSPFDVTSSSTEALPQMPRLLAASFDLGRPFALEARTSGRTPLPPTLLAAVGGGAEIIRHVAAVPALKALSGPGLPPGGDIRFPEAFKPLVRA